MCIKIGAKIKSMLGGPSLSPRTLLDWIPLATGYRASLICVSESGSLRVKNAIIKVSNSLGILSTNLTLSQKIKIVKCILHMFQNIAHLLGWIKDLATFGNILVNFLSILSTKSTISKKTKFVKICKIVFSYKFQHNE